MTDRRFYDLPDGRLSAVHFNAGKGAPRVVFANANGFNGLSYRAVLEPLGVHSVALDLRGHGFSDLPTDIPALYNWHIFARDIAAFVENYIETPIILAGHSFGAVSAILASRNLSQPLAGFVGFDPVTLPGLSRRWPYLPGGRWMMKNLIPIAKAAGKRRFLFPSEQAAFERYQGRGAFRDMPDEILWDYLRGGLKPHPDGVQLACHPSWEQAIFCAQGHNPYKAARSLPKNTTLIYGGKAAVSDRFTRGHMEKIIGPGSVVFQRDYHHLFPFHHPEAASRALEQAIKRSGL